MATKKKPATPTHPRKGLLFATAVIPLGIAAWLLLWEFGFIASVVAWGIAAGAVWLYRYGAKSDVTKATLPWLLAIIIVAVIAAFVSGMVSDLWHLYVNEIKGTGALLGSEFLSLAWDNLTYWDFVAQYTSDLLISIAFTALGAGGIVYGLLRPQVSAKA